MITVNSFSLPPLFNIEIQVFHEGKLTEGNLFDKYPKMKDIYPTKEQVSIEREILKQETKDGIYFKDF